MLAIYPEIQEKVYREIKSLDKGFGNSPGYEILCKLYYMETVIKETMRHFPVALVLGRQATDDVKLSKLNLQNRQIEQIRNGDLTFSCS